MRINKEQFAKAKRYYPVLGWALVWAAISWGLFSKIGETQPAYIFTFGTYLFGLIFCVVLSVLVGYWTGIRSLDTEKGKSDERSSGTRGIPSHVGLGEMLGCYPHAGKFTIPLGMTENKKAVFRDITAQPHLLIAGETAAGKTNMIHAVIASLLMRTDPGDLQMILVDLKGGLEFGRYEGIPHLLNVDGSDGGIIYDREKVPDALDWLIKEGESRAKKIKAAGHRSLSSYNKDNSENRIPRILLIIDEWADVMLVRGLGSKCERRLSNLAPKGKAVGIHIILATQVPKREVISTLIKTNLPGKMAFSCPTNTASILIIDNATARGLKPQGRYIYQKGPESLEIQAPFVSDQLLRSILFSNQKREKTDESK